MAFRFSPGHANPDAGDCGCGSGCKGSVCVSLAGPCLAADRSGVTLTVKDHATGATIGTATTNADGAACVTGLTPGAYDVDLAKTDCFLDPAEFVNQTVGCSTLDLASNVTCLPYGRRKFTVKGCFGTVLPDAVVTVTGPSPGSVQTDENGIAYYHYAAPGDYSATISHPSGRFADSAPVGWTVANICDSSDADPVTLAPGPDYQCCDIQKTVTPPSPYPIKKVLKVTDAGGAISFTSSNCSGTACGIRLMPNVILSSSDPVSCSDGVHNNTYNGPPTIGSDDSHVIYAITLTDVTISASQSNSVYAAEVSDGMGHDGIGYPYLVGSSPACTQNYVGYRIPTTSCDPNANDSEWAATGYTINSLYPLNVTFNFDPSGDFGPSAVPLDHYPPYSTSIVVSE